MPRKYTGDGRSPTFPFPTKFVQGPLGELAYFDHGHGDAMVFVHGLGGDFTHFENVANSFSRTHRVIGVDMPGCGLSSKPTTKLSIRAHAESLIALLDALHIDRATLVGHSAGGLVCAQASLLAPSRVEHLVLINAAGLRSYPKALRWIAPYVLSPSLLNALLEPSANWILSQVFCKRNRHTEKFAADALNRPTQPALRHMSKVFHDLSQDLMLPTIRDGAPVLAMPVLMIWGDKDRLVPLNTVESVAAQFPNATLRVIRDCGHMPPIEDPEETVMHMRVFFSQHIQRRRAA